MTSVIDTCGQDYVYTKNIQYRYGIEIDAPDLRKTTYANLGLQSPTRYCLVFSLCYNIKAVILPQMLLLEFPSVRTVPLEGLLSFLRDCLPW